MSDTDASSSSLIRSAFDVDLRAGELRKDGIGIPLQQQPFRVLARLLDHAGEVVTREALRRELWPGDTLVDFEHGLNLAIARVRREALGDEAERPRFIETLPKRGYRFITPVERPTACAPRRRVHAMVWAAVAIVLGGITAIGLVKLTLRRLSRAQRDHQRQQPSKQSECDRDVQPLPPRSWRHAERVRADYGCEG